MLVAAPANDRKKGRCGGGLCGNQRHSCQTESTFVFRGSALCATAAFNSIETAATQ